MDSRHGARAAAGLMPVQQRVQIDITDAVTVGQHERRRATEVGGGPADPRTGAAEQSGLREGDLPLLLTVVVVEVLTMTVAHVQGEVGHLGLVVEEVALDQIALVAQAEDEAAVAVAAVQLHDVPEDGLPADVDERLRELLARLSEPRAHASAEDHHGDIGRLRVR
jgi:hypothetical protein